MKKIKFEIMGKKWTLVLVPQKRFRKGVCPDTIAYTDAEARKIVLGTRGRSLETIAHELVHAYLGEMCIGSADLDSDSSEEIFADLMAKRGKELLTLADALHLSVKEEDKK